MSFHEKLDYIITKSNSLVCVGLDSDITKLPEIFRQNENPQFEFNKAIIDATNDLVCCYKPNPAFYESQGAKGIKELKMTIDYIKGIYPDVPVIVDAKRGDIGNTNEGYAQYVFDYLNGDAITLMPYMGIESLSVFFTRVGKGIIIGCHSSNQGAKEFQELKIDGKPLYQIVAEGIMKRHGDNPDTMMFMGATYPDQLTEIRKIVDEMTLLVPGIGSQGGNVEKTIKAGLNAKNAGLIINASRSIIFASKENDFAQKAREETTKLQETINTYRQV